MRPLLVLFGERGLSAVVLLGLVYVLTAEDIGLAVGVHDCEHAGVMVSMYDGKLVETMLLPEGERILFQDSCLLLTSFWLIEKVY